MSTKARRTSGYSADSFKDLDSQPAPAALGTSGVGDLRGILGPRDAAQVTNPEPVPVPAQPTQPGALPPRAAPTILSTGRPGALGTVQSNMRVPVADAELIKRVRTDLDMSSGELITAAVGDLYQAGELARHFRRQPEPGALFETRATRLPLKQPADTVYAVVSYRLTPADFATLDAIQHQVGARSRGQLITIAVREWVARQTTTKGKK